MDMRSHAGSRPFGMGVRLLAVLVTALVLGPIGSARADMEESREARLLVLQSISLIANGALAGTVTDRLRDAVDAPDQAGTNGALVRQALAIFENASGGSAGTPARDQARALLVRSIDVRAATGYGQIPPPGEVGRDVPAYANGDQSGTTVVLDELKPPRGVSDRGDLFLLVLAVSAMAAGLYLSHRWRPRDTISELRRQSDHWGRA